MPCTNGSPDARYLPPAAINDLYTSPDATYSRFLTNAVDLINRPESGDFTLAKLTVLDRIDPEQPVTKTYNHTPDKTLTVDAIKRDLDTERDPMTRLRNVMREIRSGDEGIQREAPTSSIEHDEHNKRSVDPPDNQITP